MPNSKLEILQRIVTNCQYEKVKIDGRKVLIDGASASITLQVYNALRPENQAKLLAMPLDKMILFCLKISRA